MYSIEALNARTKIHYSIINETVYQLSDVFFKEPSISDRKSLRSPTHVMNASLN